jgi:peptide deformylase
VDLQLAFNIAAALAGMLGGWVLKAISANLKELQIADKDLVAKVQQKDLDKLQVALFAKLDRIENKLDDKMDKP